MEPMMNSSSKISNPVSRISSFFVLILAIIAGGWGLYIYEESKSLQSDYTQSIVEGENALNDGHYHDAKIIFEEELRLNPKNQQAIWGLKITELKETIRQPDFKETIDQLYEEDPSNPSINLFLGEFYVNNKQFEKSIPYFEKAILENPRLAEAHNDLGIVYMHLGDYETAKIEFLNALDNSARPKYRNNLGAVYMKQKRYEEAVKEYGRNKEYPFSAIESSKIYWRLEYLSQATNYQNQAIEWLNDKAIMAKPENQEPWSVESSADNYLYLTNIEEKKSYAYFCLSVSLHLQGDKTGVENELKKMTELTPTRSNQFSTLLANTLDKLVTANPNYSDEITTYKQQYL